MKIQALRRLTVVEERIAFPCPGIVQRNGAAEFYGLGESFTNAAPQPHYLFPGHPLGAKLRRNLSAKQRLAGVDVSHAGDQRLVQELDLDGLFRTLQIRGESLECKLRA